MSFEVLSIVGKKSIKDLIIMKSERKAKLFEFMKHIASKDKNLSIKILVDES